MFEEIIYEVSKGRARVTLNKPERRNALSVRMQAELCDALWEADNDRAVHSVILRGAGISFCAGYDLNRYEAAVPIASTDAPERTYRGHRSLDDDVWQQERAQRFRMALFDMHKPSVAQVHGHCLAGGMDIALLCDMVIAADDAIFGFPPARDLGSLPSNMWIYHVGPQWAKRLTLSGDSINGSEAQQIGLILKAVPLQYLEGEVEQLADRFSLIDSDLLSVNKRSVNVALELMGARTVQRISAENNARGHNTQAANDYRRSVKEKGLKETFKARDAKFGDGRARVNGPEIRGPDGKLRNIEK